MKNQLLHFICVTALMACSFIGYGQITANAVALNCDMLVLSSGQCAPGNTQLVTGQCSAFVDNAAFELKEVAPVSATIAEPSSINEGTGARSIVNITVAGRNDPAYAESQAGETIQLSVALTEPIAPGAAGFKVSLNHNGALYTLVKGDDSNVEVTDFIWSRDRKSFMLSLNFNCTMRNPAFLATGQKDLHLKGKLLRVKVMVPGAASASN